MKRITQLPGIDKAFVGILLAIFGGIVLHAPLSVAFGVLFPDYELIIKSWKEILMVVAAVLAAILVWKKKRTALVTSPLMIVIWAYIGLHILTALILQGEWQAVVAGLLIDLRYIAFFVLVYIAVSLYPHLRSLFVKVGIAGALTVTLFALLQVFVLPIDVLKYIGYGTSTIAPYLTVDLNEDYIRINSTMRGPNSLGAYAVIVLAGVAAWTIARTRRVSNSQAIIVSLLAVGGVTALWFSYSRSALVAAFVAIAVIAAITLRHRISRKVWISGSVIALAIIGGLVAARDSDFVSNVLLHENPNGGSSVKSNDGHLESLAIGTDRMIRQPIGAGIGSTGSASLFGDDPIIIENQYLFIAHEVGWLGLGLFIAIFVMVFTELWKRRSDWLAVTVLASGVGMALIALLLPVWADDTVAIVWWGLAAIVLAGKHDD